MGEYQPCMGSDGARTPDGEPVPNYYPAVITEGQFGAVAAAMTARRRVGVVDRSAGRNLFSGIVKGEDRCPWVLHNKGSKAEMLLARSDGIHGTGPYLSVYYRVFEQVVLGTLREVTPAELVTSAKQRTDAERLAEAQGRLAAVTEKMAVFEGRIYEEPSSTTWPKMLDRARGERETLLAEVQDARRALAVPVVEGVAEAHTLIDLLAKDTSKELRQKLRAKIATVVSEVKLSVYVAQRYTRIGWAQIAFRHVPYVRNVLFVHQTARRSKDFVRAEAVTVLPLNEPPALNAGFSDRLIEACAEIERIQALKATNPDKFKKEAAKLAAKYLPNG